MKKTLESLANTTGSESLLWGLCAPLVHPEKMSAVIVHLTFKQTSHFIALSTKSIHIRLDLTYSKLNRVFHHDVLYFSLLHD